MELLDWLLLGGNIVLLCCFFWFYLRDPRRLVNGVLFLLSAGFLYGSLLYVAIAYQLVVLRFLVIGLGMALLLALGLASLLLIITSLLNFIVLIRREGLKPTNLLILLFALALIGLNLISSLRNSDLFSPNVNLLFGYANTLAFYCIFLAVNFLVTSFLCQLWRPRHNQDYIIVLGAGLKNGVQVSKLLADRIDKALAFYRRQKQHRQPPKLIFSGGQGADEAISEAFAMQAYALSQGLPVEDTLLEERSTSTYENMQFSQQLIHRRQAGKPYRVLYATNNFHVLRAGLYARQLGLKAYGLSARTAAYYWPNATLREFGAYLVMHKKTHLGVLVFVSVLYLFYFILTKTV